MSSPKQKALKIAADLGVTIVEDWDGAKLVQLTAEAPEGTTWASSDVHEFVCSDWHGGAPAAELWADLAERMGPGVEECVGPCDWCGH